jgi:hypothetical protein
MDRFTCVELYDFPHSSVTSKKSAHELVREFGRLATRLFEIRDQNGNPCGVTASEELAAMLGCPSVQVASHGR